MVSRPLIAGTLAGWWLGDPALGLEIGAIFELFHLAGVPAGGSRVPESGPASVVAVAVCYVRRRGRWSGMGLGGRTGGLRNRRGDGGSAAAHGRPFSGPDRSRVHDGADTDGRASFVGAPRFRARSGGYGGGAGPWRVVCPGFSRPRWPLAYETTLALILIGASVHLGAFAQGVRGLEEPPRRLSDRARGRRRGGIPVTDVAPKRPPGWMSGFFRQFMIQGSWNYRSILGSGFAFCMIPLLRKRGLSGDGLDDAVRSQMGTFNAHPYLAGVALGAVARMEGSGTDAETVERFSNGPSKDRSEGSGIS